MTNTPNSSERYCPSCGTRTTQAFCPNDGVATLERRRLDVDSAGIHVGDLVSGRYRVTGILGKGGFGAVYSAEHTGTQQAVALKMLLSSSDASEDEVRRFHREAQVTAQLRHPNTVRVFDVGQTDGGALYIAMELLHGLSLEQELKQRSRAGQVLRQDEALEVGVAVLRSLSEAHNQGLVHRDLKPANIMLTEIDGERVVKVLDFGIARQHDSSLTGEGKTLGTPAYMSPEQCRGAKVDGRSDLYSLGIILYRCVAGNTPFEDSSPLALIFKHASEPPPDLRGAARTSLSDGFVQTVMKSLSKRADDRFVDARAMRDALVAVQKGEVVPAATSAFRVGRRGGDTAGDLPSVFVRFGGGDGGTEPEFDTTGDSLVPLPTPEEVHGETLSVATPGSLELAAGADPATRLTDPDFAPTRVESTKVPPGLSPASQLQIAATKIVEDAGPPVPLQRQPGARTSLDGPAVDQPKSKAAIWLAIGVAMAIGAGGWTLSRTGDDAPTSATAQTEATATVDTISKPAAVGVTNEATNNAVPRAEAAGSTEAASPAEAAAAPQASQSAVDAGSAPSRGSEHQPPAVEPTVVPPTMPSTVPTSQLGQGDAAPEPATAKRRAETPPAAPAPGPTPSPMPAPPANAAPARVAGDEAPVVAVPTVKNRPKTHPAAKRAKPAPAKPAQGVETYVPD